MESAMNSVIHSEIRAMVADGKMSADKQLQISDLRERLISRTDWKYSSAEVSRNVRDAGYTIYRLAEGDVVSLLKTNEQIEALKANWSKDPCWDIEDTEGFEGYREELINWRVQRELKIENEITERNKKRVEFVETQTGVNDADIALELHTWHEIERQVERAITSEYPMMDLLATQIRATLLQAAQIKRLADALEQISDKGLSVDAVTSGKYEY